MTKPKSAKPRTPKLSDNLSMSDLDKLMAEINAIRQNKHREKHELIGARVAKVLDNPAESPLKTEVLALLKATLVKDKDRAIFGFDPLPKTKAKGKKKPAAENAG